MQDFTMMVSPIDRDMKGTCLPLESNDYARTKQQDMFVCVSRMNAAIGGLSAVWTKTTSKKRKQFLASVVVQKKALRHLLSIRRTTP